MIEIYKYLLSATDISYLHYSIEIIDDCFRASIMELSMLKAKREE